MSTNIQAGANHQRKEETEANSSRRNSDMALVAAVSLLLPIRVSPYFAKMRSPNYKQTQSL